MNIHDLFDPKFVEIVAIKKDGNFCFKTVPVADSNNEIKTLPMFPAEKERKSI